MIYNFNPPDLLLQGGTLSLTFVSKFNVEHLKVPLGEEGFREIDYSNK